jgi:hypothetical protein
VNFSDFLTLSTNFTGGMLGVADEIDPRIIGSVRDGALQLVNTTDEDISLLGIDVNSQNGGLKANGAGPFAITLLDSPGEVTTGNLGSPFVLAAGATVTTEIAVGADATGLTAQWGGVGTPPVRFEITIPIPGDCNGDGVADAGDLDCACGAGELGDVLAATGLTAGDIDGNGEVALADFLVLSTNFNQAVSGYTAGDLDCNGNVNFSDFLTLSTNFTGGMLGVADEIDPRIIGSVRDGALQLVNTTNEDISLLGIDVQSQNGGLKANGAGPFTITLLDSPGEITTGNLGNPFVLAAGATVTTEIAVGADAANLTAQWGGVGTPPVRFEIITSTLHREDRFDASVGELTLIGPDGAIEFLTARGVSQINVLFDGPNAGDALDSDGDGLDDVTVGLEVLNLQGENALGPIAVRLATNAPRSGQTEEQANDNLGILDLPPYSPTSSLANSVLDTSIEVELLIAKDPIQRVIEDFTNISGASADIASVDAGVIDDQLFLNITFSQDTDMDDIAGIVGLDTDQNSGTGMTQQRLGYSAPEQDAGFERLLFVRSAVEVDVIRDNGAGFDTIGTIDASTVDRTISIIVPLDLLDDDGNVDLALLFGRNTQNGLTITDFAPNQGHGTVLVRNATELVIWHTSIPIQLRGTLSGDPTAIGDSYSSLDVVQLVAENGEPTGYSLQFTTFTPNSANDQNPLIGDANNDGEVGFEDFLILAQNFGKVDAVFADGDFNLDGVVGFADFLLLANNFGQGRNSA